jgi:predicted DNA-binding protein
MQILLEPIYSDLTTVREACDVYGCVSPSTIYKHIELGNLPAYKYQGRIHVRSSEVKLLARETLPRGNIRGRRKSLSGRMKAQHTERLQLTVPKRTKRKLLDLSNRLGLTGAQIVREMIETCSDVYLRRKINKIAG